MGNGVIIFVMTQIIGKDIVTYVSGGWEWHCASDMIKKHTKNFLYIYKTEK